MMNERVYISGPITGRDRDEVCRTFMEAEQQLRAVGYCRIVNPVRLAVFRWPRLYRLLGYNLTLLYCLWRLTRCHRILLLPGWRDSTGACVESFLAYKLRISRVPDVILSQMPMFEYMESANRNKNRKGNGYDRR